MDKVAEAVVTRVKDKRKRKWTLTFVQKNFTNITEWGRTSVWNDEIIKDKTPNFVLNCILYTGDSRYSEPS